MAHRHFTSMTPAGAQFYNRLMNQVVLNIWAVRMGLFDTLLCETDDPEVALRWSAALPRIILTIEASRGPSSTST